MLYDNTYKYKLMVFPTSPKQSWLPLMPIRIGNYMLVGLLWNVVVDWVMLGCQRKGEKPRLVAGL